MRKKVSLTLNGTSYTIELEKAFALYLEMQMAKDFNIEGNNDAKSVLYAYVRKNADLFKQEEEVNDLLTKLDELL